MTKRVLSLALAVILTASMITPVFAEEAPDSTLETKSVEINSDFDGDGTPDWTWTLPGVIKTQKVKIGGGEEILNDLLSDEKIKKLYESLSFPKEIDTEIDLFDLYRPLLNKEMDLHTIKAGTKIPIAGAYNRVLLKIKYIGDYTFTIPIKTNGWDGIIEESIPNSQDVIIVDRADGDIWYGKYGDGSYISFIEKGYYIMALHPFVSQYYNTNTQSQNFQERIDENVYKYGFAAIRVIE